MVTHSAPVDRLRPLAHRALSPLTESQQRAAVQTHSAALFGVPKQKVKRKEMSVTDQLVKNNQSYADGFTKGDLPMPPGKKVAVLACMDARLDVHKILGLEEGDAHVIRNAGGVATDDAIRSLVISQRLLGTEEIVLIHHTDCGMLTFRDDELKSAIQKETGIRPQFALEAFGDLEEDVRQSIRRIEVSPFIPKKTGVRGFVYDVKSGKLDEVEVLAASRA
jgi:carbonic anhydrase